jgi:hypothetical protein
VLPILLSVALLLLNPTTARVAAAGALSAVALALTIKAVLWAPAFIGVLAVGCGTISSGCAPILAGTMTGIATYAGIMLAHRWAIATEANPEPAIAVDRLAGIGSYMFFDGLFPMWEVLWIALVQNPATWLLIASGSAWQWPACGSRSRAAIRSPCCSSPCPLSPSSSIPMPSPTRISF